VTYPPNPADQPWQQNYNVDPYGQAPYPPTNPYQDPSQPVTGPGYQQPGYPDPNQPVTGPGGYGQPGYPQPGYQQPAPGYQQQPPGYPQPGYPTPAYQPPAGPPAKKTNVGLIVALIAAFLIVCGGSGVAGLIWLGKKSDNNTGTATATSSTGSKAGDDDPTTGPTNDTKPDTGGLPTAAIGATQHLKATSSDASEADVTVSDPRVEGNDVVVTVKVTVTKGSFPVNPLYIILKDAAGKEYDVDFGGGDRFLEPGRLPAGQSETGDVAFEAPKSILTSGLVEVDAPFEPAGYWKLGG
jgi:hypothetical protein